jgi:small subunit ribosomal protein S17
MADTNKADATERTEAGKSGRRVLQGRVVSDKMDKTVVVAVERVYRHPLYKKTVRRTKRYKAHDEQNQCGVGDLVEITETRHLSKDKYFRVSRIIEKAK